MNQQTNSLPTQFVSMVRDCAIALEVDETALRNVLSATVMNEGTPAEVQAFLMVATRYKLDPVVKQIYAFPTRGGGIQPIVSIDGWLLLANRQPTFDGMEFEYEHDCEGKLLSCTCIVYRKDRGHPTRVAEFLSECYREKRPGKADGPWQTHPYRMLRHRAIIQALRITFGFSGIMERDEFEAWQEREAAMRTIDAKGRRDLDEIRQRGREVAGALSAPQEAEFQAWPDAAPRRHESDLDRVEAASAAPRAPSSAPARATEPIRADASAEAFGAATRDESASQGSMGGAEPKAEPLATSVDEPAESPLGLKLARVATSDALDEWKTLGGDELVGEGASLLAQRGYSATYTRSIAKQLGVEEFARLPQVDLAHLVCLMDQDMLEDAFPFEGATRV